MSIFAIIALSFAYLILLKLCLSVYISIVRLKLKITSVKIFILTYWFLHKRQYLPAFFTKIKFKTWSVGGYTCGQGKTAYQLQLLTCRMIQIISFCTRNAAMRLKSPGLKFTFMRLGSAWREKRGCGIKHIRHSSQLEYTLISNNL